MGELSVELSFERVPSFETTILLRHVDEATGEAILLCAPVHELVEEDHAERGQQTPPLRAPIDGFGAAGRRVLLRERVAALHRSHVSSLNPDQTEAILCDDARTHGSIGDLEKRREAPRERA